MGQHNSTTIKPTLSSESTISAGNNTFSTPTHTTKHPLNVQNFVLIWLDPKIDEFDADFKQSLTQLRRIVNTIELFIDVDRCIDFLTEIKDEKVFMIVSNILGQQLVFLIHNIPQLYSIYIFCGDKVNYTVWTNEWTKVKGVFNQIQLICNSLEQDTKNCDHDLIPISIVSPNECSKQDSNVLEPSFMYSQILKEILISIEYKENTKQQLIQLWREQYHNNEFEQDYYRHSPIWWYTRDCFICQMLNRALRLQEINTILQLGFFIRDLHQQIQQLYVRPSEVLIVYRGQGLLNVDFKKMYMRQGSLLSFNNFLSTSTDRQVSLLYAESSRGNPELTGILFRITINPAFTSTPFAALDNVSFFSDSEKEILFSMHTVFRIGQMKSIEDRLWLIELTLTSDDDDKELKGLTGHIREEIHSNACWSQLAMLLCKMGKFDQAEEVYYIVLRETSYIDEKNLATIYLQLGYIKNSKGSYEEALEFFQKAIEIQQKYLPPNHPELAYANNHMGGVHLNIGECSKALEFFQKSLEIQQKSLPPNHRHLAGVNNNMGTVYLKIGEHSKALEYFQKAIEIQQKSLPPNHPELAVAYNNIAETHFDIGEYSEALEFLQKSLEIQQKSLPPNHPYLATGNNNMGIIHSNIGEHSKALEYFQKAIEIQQKTLPPNHPELALAYNNMGGVHLKIGECSKALEFLQKSLEIRQKSLPHNHPDLAISYSTVGMVHRDIGEYSKALSLYQKAIEIQQKSLPSNHPELATSYNNMGTVYLKTGECSKALELFQKTIKILQKSLPPNHPELAVAYYNITKAHVDMKEYSKALNLYQRILEIQRSSLPPSHPDLALTYNSIGQTYYRLGEYSEVILFLKCAIQIGQHSLPDNHFFLIECRKALAIVLQQQKNCNIL